MNALRKNLPVVVTVVAAALIAGSFAVPAFNGYVERSRVARARRPSGFLCEIQSNDAFGSPG